MLLFATNRQQRRVTLLLALMLGGHSPFFDDAQADVTAPTAPAEIVPDENGATPQADEPPPPAAVTPAKPPAMRFEESPPLLHPKPRSPLQQQQLQAGALVATGSTLLRKEKLKPALQYFQRAWRTDQNAVSLLDDIVPLAFKLNRPDVAIRYAVLAADDDFGDPRLLRKLALTLAELGQHAEAAQMYRKWLVAMPDQAERPPFEVILIYLEIGRLDYLAGNIDSASTALEKLQQKLLSTSQQSDLRDRLAGSQGGDLNTIWELCGLTHLEAGRWQLSEQAFQQLDLPLARQAEVDYLLAQVASAKGDPAAGLDRLTRYLNRPQGPADIGPPQLLITLLQQLNQPEMVTVQLNELQRRFPRNLPIALTLGEHLQENDMDQITSRLYAAFLARELSGSNSSNFETEANREYFLMMIDQLAAIYTRDEAVAPLARMLSTASQITGGKAMLPETTAAVRDKPELLPELVVLLPAIAKDISQPNSQADLAALVARLAGEVGEFELASPLLEQSLTGPPVDQLSRRFAWGLQLLEGERYAVATDQFARVAKLAEQVSLPEWQEQAHFHQAAALALDGKSQAALELTDELSSKRPDSLEYAIRRPWILQLKNQEAEAYEAYIRVTEEFAGTADSIDREILKSVYLILSSLAARLDDYQAAEEWLEKVLDDYPRDTGTMNDLGFLWVEQNKNLSQARSYIETALEADSDNPAYIDSLAWLEYQEGNYELAETLLRKAARYSHHAGDVTTDNEAAPAESPYPRFAQADPVILDHLADVLIKNEKSEFALQIWKQAINNCSDDPVVQQRIRQKIEQHLPPEKR